ncbi:MAG: DUF5131 family protein, partial [Acidobacteriota bacterium]
MSVERVELIYRSWNPIRGCTRVSTGCLNCYAERFAFRLSGTGQPYEGLVEKTDSGPRWNGQIRLVEELLTEPLHWRKPSLVFINSMSDIFHDAVPDKFINDIIRTVEESSGHIFFILTKRAERM